MNRSSKSNKNARPGMFSISSLRTGAVAAGRGLKGAYKDVAQSVAVVQQERAANGAQGSFLAQVRDQVSHDRSKKREEEERGTQRLSLFPGWAVRRVEGRGEAINGIPPFRIDVFVSGFAYSMRPPDRATRSQKAFMRIAQAFASLPKLPPSSGPERADSLAFNAALSKSTEDLLKMTTLPPRPDEMTPDKEAQILQKHADLGAPLQPPRPNFISQADPEPMNAQRQMSGGCLFTHKNSSSSSVSSLSTTTSFSGLDTPEIMRLHDNFHNRLRPFWARPVTTGTVRISLYTVNYNTGVIDRQYGPIATAEIAVAADTGYFGKLFTVPFETICQHRGGAQIAYGDHLMQHRLTAIAEYIAPPPLPAVAASVLGQRVSEPAYAPPVQSSLHSLPLPSAQTDFDVSNARVRLISDIDDTIKVSNILHGVRAVFRNVFVKELGQLACPGMPDFYAGLSAQGVKFHYVSNSPFELLPVLDEFLKVLGYPAGSLKLKYYGGRSLFKGLWEPAGERKRAGVVEIMDYFPDAKFFLVGDSGEQDMELYTALAKEFHRANRNQILGIFIRDVNPEPSSFSAESTSASQTSSPPTYAPPEYESLIADRSDTLETGAFLPVSSSNTTNLPFTSSPAPYDSTKRTSYYGQVSSPAALNSNPSFSATQSSFSGWESDRNSTVTPGAGQRPTPPLPPRHPSSRTSSVSQVPQSAVIRGSTPTQTQFQSFDTFAPHQPHHQNSTDSSLSMSDPAIAAAVASAAASTPSLAKKRAEFKLRLAKCQEGMPSEIPFVIFVHPEEVMELADNLLAKALADKPRLY